jgi:hypothetical protein
MFAPIENMWGAEGQDPQEILADLQRMNEQARIEQGQRALNALNGPKRLIQPGFARGNGSTFGMGAGLDTAVREQQERQNRLLGSAMAISDLTGKTEVRGMTNAPPSIVNNMKPTRVGTEGEWGPSPFEDRQAQRDEEEKQRRADVALYMTEGTSPKMRPPESQDRINMALDLAEERQGLQLAPRGLSGGPGDGSPGKLWARGPGGEEYMQSEEETSAQQLERNRLMNAQLIAEMRRKRGGW